MTAILSHHLRPTTHASSILPGYTWTGERYRSSASGRFVSRKDILSLTNDQVTASSARMSDLTVAVTEGRITPAVWQEQMRTEQRRLTLQNSALGSGGWDQMTPKDFGRVGASLRQDYARITGTAADIADGKITLPEALARVNRYAGNARVQYYLAEKDRVRPSAPNMVIIWRRILGDAKHCQSCLDYYEDGWSLNVFAPGEACECGGHCKCRVEQKEVPISELNDWLGTKK